LNNSQIAGYSTSAALLIVDVPTSTSVSSAWRNRRSPSVADSAIAAEAPQMATAPPDKVPKAEENPRLRAASMPAPMVMPTMATTASSDCGPRAMICSSVMRAPTSTMAQRNNSLLASVRPGVSRRSADRKFMASPISSANRVSGAP
jgi:hypothetical protein